MRRSRLLRGVVSVSWTVSARYSRNVSSISCLLVNYLDWLVILDSVAENFAEILLLSFDLILEILLAFFNELLDCWLLVFFVLVNHGSKCVVSILGFGFE